MKKFLSGTNAHRLVRGIPQPWKYIFSGISFCDEPATAKCFQDSLEDLGSKTVKKFPSGANAHRLGRDVPQSRNYNFNSLQFFPPRHSRGPGMKHRDASYFCWDFLKIRTSKASKKFLSGTNARTCFSDATFLHIRSQAAQMREISILLLPLPVSPAAPEGGATRRLLCMYSHHAKGGCEGGS